MSCFADLGSCQSCKSQEQCKRKGTNMDKPLALWPVFHHNFTNYFTHLASCLTTHQLSPLKFLWSLVIAGVTGATGRGIIRAVRPAPFQGGRNSLHILEMWKKLEKNMKGEEKHLALQKMWSWIEIDYIILHPQHNSRILIRSVSLQIGDIGKSYKIRVKLNTLVHWYQLCTWIPGKGNKNWAKIGKQWQDAAA